MESRLDVEWEGKEEGLWESKGWKGLSEVTWCFFFKFSILTQFYQNVPHIELASPNCPALRPSWNETDQLTPRPVLLADGVQSPCRKVPDTGQIPDNSWGSALICLPWVSAWADAPPILCPAPHTPFLFLLGSDQEGECGTSKGQLIGGSHLLIPALLVSPASLSFIIEGWGPEDALTSLSPPVRNQSSRAWRLAPQLGGTRESHRPWWSPQPWSTGADRSIVSQGTVPPHGGVSALSENFWYLIWLLFPSSPLLFPPFPNTHTHPHHPHSLSKRCSPVNLGCHSKISQTEVLRQQAFVSHSVGG